MLRANYGKDFFVSLTKILGRIWVNGDEQKKARQPIGRANFNYHSE